MSSAQYRFEYTLKGFNFMKLRWWGYINWILSNFCVSWSHFSIFLCLVKTLWFILHHLCLTSFTWYDSGFTGEEVIDKSHAHLVPPPASQSPNPLPTTKQQSNSNGQAAAPSTGKRTTSKSIAASALQPDSVIHLACSFLLLMRLLLLSE